MPCPALLDDGGQRDRGLPLRPGRAAHLAGRTRWELRGYLEHTVHHVRLRQRRPPEPGHLPNGEVVASAADPSGRTKTITAPTRSGGEVRPVPDLPGQRDHPEGHQPPAGHHRYPRCDHWLPVTGCRSLCASCKYRTTEPSRLVRRLARKCTTTDQHTPHPASSDTPTVVCLHNSAPHTPYKPLTGRNAEAGNLMCLASAELRPGGSGHGGGIVTGGQASRAVRSAVAVMREVSTQASITRVPPPGDRVPGSPGWSANMACPAARGR